MTSLNGKQTNIMPTDGTLNLSSKTAGPPKVARSGAKKGRRAKRRRAESPDVFIASQIEGYLAASRGQDATVQPPG